MYAYRPVKQVVTPPPTDADKMLVEDQAEADGWLRAVEVRRQTGEWPRGE
jgi:hypothetical protein